MREAMPKCTPVLLEPIMHVEIAVPNSYTAKVQRLVTAGVGRSWATTPSPAGTAGMW